MAVTWAERQGKRVISAGLSPRRPRSRYHSGWHPLVQGNIALEHKSHFLPVHTAQSGVKPW